MSNTELKQVWKDNYLDVSNALKDMQKVKAVSTAFNSNIDAVIKLSGKKIAELILDIGISWIHLRRIGRNKIHGPRDFIKALVRCFEKGIAEEWITEKPEVYEWLMQKVGYDRLQMGGQAGIVGNALATCGVQKVFVHANSLPKKQAEQFLKLDNLLSFDEKGKVCPAYKINRKKDVPLIHWILEFDKGDVIECLGHKIVCPKSNRFIATYDPLNLNLIIDKAFVKDINNQELDYVILSGFHALTSNSGRAGVINKAFPVIKKWRESSPNAIIHLELASTQDLIIRKAIVDKIVPKVDSIGMNERETIDVLEILDEEELANKCDNEPNSINLFNALVKIKEKTNCPRIQLHMFGLYITLQNNGYRISPENNRKGMVLASSVAAHKAKIGIIDNCVCEPMWSLGRSVSDVGLEELTLLSKYLKRPNMMQTGIAKYADMEVIAVPTILVDNPVTLVGMGDTISSISLFGSFDEKIRAPFWSK